MVHKQPIMWVVDKSSTISEMWGVWLDKPTEGRALSLTHFGYLNNHVKPRRKKKTNMSKFCQIDQDGCALNKPW